MITQCFYRKTVFLVEFMRFLLLCVPICRVWRLISHFFGSLQKHIKLSHGSRIFNAFMGVRKLFMSPVLVATSALKSLDGDFENWPKNESSQTNAFHKIAKPVLLIPKILKLFLKSWCMSRNSEANSNILLKRKSVLIRKISKQVKRWSNFIAPHLLE